MEFNFVYEPAHIWHLKTIKRAEIVDNPIIIRFDKVEVWRLSTLKRNSYDSRSKKDTPPSRIMISYSMKSRGKIYLNANWPVLDSTSPVSNFNWKLKSFTYVMWPHIRANYTDINIRIRSRGMIHLHVKYHNLTTINHIQFQIQMYQISSWSTKTATWFAGFLS